MRIIRSSRIVIFLTAAFSFAGYAAADTNLLGSDYNAPACNQSPSCDPQWHWNAGVEGTFLDPHFHGTGNPDADAALSFVDPGWTEMPRIWLGIENNSGWGRWVRYWELSDHEDRIGLTNVQPGALLDIFQNLNMYDIDAELTKRFDLGYWNLLGSFGGRFGSLERFDMANFFNTVGPPGSMSFQFNNRCDAGGLTAALEISRPIGIGSLQVFGSFRASELWGDSNAFVAIHQPSGSGGNATLSDRFAADLTILETQVGLQCSKQLASCEGTVYARCAFEYQSWVWSVPGGAPGGGLIFNPGVDLYGVAVAIGFQH